MARPLRIEFPNALYHITSRGNAQENIYHNLEGQVVRRYRLLADKVLPEELPIHLGVTVKQPLSNWR